MNPLPGIRVSVVSRELHSPYSGMLPGLVAGHYTFDEAHIDLGPLSQAAGARLIAAEVTGLSLTEQRIVCAGRPDLRFDILSINSGGAPDLAAVSAPSAVIAVKPISRFLPRWHSLLVELERGELGAMPQLVVVGGGAGGIELTLAIAHRLADSRIAAQIVLVTADTDIVSDHSNRVRRHLRRALERYGVRVEVRFTAASWKSGALTSQEGSSVIADRVLWVTGVDAPPWARESGLAVDERGFIRVDATLRSLSHPNVFAAGDVAALDGQPRPKSGVFAVREGPYLAANLQRVIEGRAPRHYRAQRRVLAIISEGSQRAIASRGAVSIHGAWVWRVKHWIDQRFMDRFDVRSKTLASGSVSLDPMRCGGCGSKLSADLLHRVLRRLDIPVHASVITGIGDDAAVIDARGPIAATVDGFRAMIEDPYRLGRIAAHHAMSDIYAMGGVPTAALALVTVPLMADAMMEDELFQLMSGACEVLREDGAALAGGHSNEGAELSVSLAVMGVAPRSAWRKASLASGDVLLVTKAIGTGVLLAGRMRGVAYTRDVEYALAAMDDSNGRAARVLARYGVRAVTDVTGFGLLGHLAEMLHASGLGARIKADAVPVLPGALALIDQGVESTLAPSNARVLADFQIVDGPPTDSRVRVLIDPQTCGGLLFGIPSVEVDACVAELVAAGYSAAAIGSVDRQLQPGGGRIELSEGARKNSRLPA